MNQLLLNSTNYDKTNNTLSYVFPIPQKFNSDMEIGISDFTFFNQFFNVSSSIGNNVIKIVTPDNTTYSFTMNDGFYTIDDLNTFLTTKQFENGLYVTTNNVVNYCVQFSKSKTTGNNQLILIPFQNSYCYITWNKTLSNLYGFENTQSSKRFPYTLPSSTTPIVYSQTTFADVYRVNSIYITCNLINIQGFGNVSNLMVAMPIAQTNFGDVIEFGKFHKSIEFMKINEGMYNSIDLNFYDQDGNKLQFFDTNLLLCLVLRKKPSLKN